jgi:hypothetical protein
MFDGLYLFEWVLMVLGVILFVVLVIGFFYQLTHKGNIVALLGFFLVPVAMIGYPSLQSIQIKDGVVTLDKTTDALHANPTDTSTRQSLEQQVTKLGQRSFSDAATLTSLSKAQFALGDEQTAKANLSKALQMNPGLSTAKELQTKIASVDQLATLTSKVQSNPGDQQAKEQLSQVVNTASQQPIANPSALLKVAQAQAALGDEAKAAQTTAIVRRINPKLLTMHQ